MTAAGADACSHRMLRQAGTTLAAVALCWAAIVNGQPFFFPDTTAYIRGAEMGFVQATGIRSAWSSDGAAPQTGPGEPVESSKPAASRGVIAGRSVYYGALLNAAARAGSLWIVVAFQALLVTACVTQSWICLTGRRREAPLVIIALAVLTPVPFYVGFLMPDVLAGLAVLSCA